MAVAAANCCGGSVGPTLRTAPPAVPGRVFVDELPVDRKRDDLVIAIVAEVEVGYFSYLARR
jgi:hypothetical protein